MSLFSGLKKCENEFCPRYIYEKDKGKYTNEKMSLCSAECVHVAQISQYLNKAQGKLDRNLFLEHIREHFEKFKEEAIAEYKGRIKELEIEKEKLELQMKTTSTIIPLSASHPEASPAAIASQEVTKSEIQPAPIAVSNADSVISMMGTDPSKQLTASAGQDESSANPFEEEVKASQSAPSVPEVPFDYIVPVRSTFRLKDPDLKARETLEFAAAIYSVGEAKTVATFHRFVRPTMTGKLTEKEVSTLGIRQDQLDSAKDLAGVLDDFDVFMKENKMETKKFGMLFTRHMPIGKRLYRETKMKGIKLREYFLQYINLRAVFINIYRNKKGLLNLQKIEKKLKHRPIEQVIYHLEDMVDLLNMKFKTRFVNNLDLVDNIVKICQKLSEKGFVFSNKLLYHTVTEGNYWEGKKGDKKGSIDVREFEIV